MKGILIAVTLVALMFPALGSAHERVVQRDHRQEAALRHGHHKHPKYFHGQMGYHHHGTIIVYSLHRSFVHPSHRFKRYRAARYKRLHRHHTSYRARHRNYR